MVNILLCICSSDRLPFSIRVLLESAVRNCDEFLVKRSDVESILNWKQTQTETVEVPFRPARVILQDFTYVDTIHFHHVCELLHRLLETDETLYRVLQNNPNDAIVMSSG